MPGSRTRPAPGPGKSHLGVAEFPTLEVSALVCQADPTEKDVTRDEMAQAETYKTIAVEPFEGGFGAEVTGVDLARPLGPRAFAEIKWAYDTHALLFFRGQRLTPEQQIAFSKRFGPLLRVPYVEPLPDHPDIIAVLKEAGERDISTFGGTWHSDFSFLERPPSASLLYALEVPAEGGDTLWADMCRAYETLPGDTKARIEPLRAIHDGAPYGTNGPPPGLKLSASIKITRGDPSADAETAHPLVRRLPETGRKALFANPVYTARIEGMSADESRSLLEELQAHATRPEFACRFRWRPGSLAVWDNRRTQHMAVNDYDGERRLLHRTTVTGERPLGFA